MDIELKKEIITKGYKDLLFLAKTLDPKAFYLPFAQVHKEIAELIISDTRQLVIEAPRGIGKSKLNLWGTIHHILYDEGDKLIVIQSKTRKEAVNRLSDIKDIFQYNKMFRELFGYAGEQVAEIWREDRIKVKVGGFNVSIYALGTGQPVKGMLEGDTRITYYVLDDPEDEDNTVTKDQMDKNFDKFIGGIPGLDRRNGRVRVIGTPITQGCIVERLINSSGWTSKVYKCIQDDGSLLWEEMYPLDWLEKKKEEFRELGMLWKFYSEYQCEVKGKEDQIFKEEDLRYYEGEIETINGENYLILSNLDDKDIKEKIPVNVYIGCDPASSTERYADYSVIMLIAYDGRRIFVIDYYRKRALPTDVAEKLIEYIKKYSPQRVHIETVAYQDMLRVYLKERLEEEGIYVAGLEKKISTNGQRKETRLEGLSHLFVNHRVHMKKSMSEFINELIIFPYGKHDDTLDAFYYATIKLSAPIHNEEVSDVHSESFLKSIFRQSKLKTNWQTA